MTRHLSAIDLFSGAGGFSEGLESAGIKIVLAQELHPQPALTLSFNHYNTPVMVGDIRELKPALMKQLIERHHHINEVDVIVGGPPCQGFSTAGKKDIDDPRNSLFSNYCNIVDYFKPKIVVLENVPGFKKMYHGKIYKEAITKFTSLGYRLKDTILNAVDYGVPQRRTRFIMVGIRKDLDIEFNWPKPTHVNPESSNPLFSSSLINTVTVENALSDLEFVLPGHEAHKHTLAPKSEYQKERRGNCEYIFNHLTTRHREKAVAIFELIKEGKTISSVPSEIKSAKRTMARLNRHHISNTVLALPDDFIHYNQDRIPSVREMARLQSFDDDFVFFGKRTSGFKERRVDVPQYTQVGNAVPPLLAKAIATEIIQALDGDHSDIRNKGQRQERLSWVRGSSGFAGYTLGHEACLPIYDIHGEKIELPIDENPPRAIEQSDIFEWKGKKRNGLKRQWAPGVKLPG